MTRIEQQPKRFPRRGFLKMAGGVAAAVLLGCGESKSTKATERLLNQETKEKEPETREYQRTEIEFKRVKTNERGELKDDQEMGPSRLPEINPEERQAIERDYMLNGKLKSPFYIDEYGIATWGWILPSGYESTSWSPQDGFCLRGDRKRPWATEGIKMKDGRILHVVFEYPERTSLENGKPIRERSNREQDSPDVKIYDAYSKLCSGDEDYSEEREYDYIEGPNGQKTYYVVEHGKCDRRLYDGPHRAVRVWFVQNEQEAINYCAVSTG